MSAEKKERLLMLELWLTKATSPASTNITFVGGILNVTNGAATVLPTLNAPYNSTYKGSGTNFWVKNNNSGTNGWVPK